MMNSNIFKEDNKNDSIFNYINTKNYRKKNKKADIFKIIELEEIGIDNNIAELLIKRKITKEEKNIIDNYLKNQIKNSYNLDYFDNNLFLCIINFYLYGFENSLPYFRNINSFIKKDILIKLMLYKNVLDSFEKDTIKNDIYNIKDFIENLIKQEDEKNNEEISDQISTFSYTSDISRTMDLIEREKDILQIEYNELQIKYNKIREENNKLKKQNEKLEKRNNLTSSKLLSSMQNLKIT